MFRRFKDKKKRKSLLLFKKKSDITSKPGCQSTFTPSTFTRSLVFRFLSMVTYHVRAGYSA